MKLFIGTRRVLILGGVMVIGVASLLYATRAKPVLLHVLAEDNCACGEFHEAVTGIIVRNPLRDRSPEAKAHSFLNGLREGKGGAQIPSEVCSYGLNEHRVEGWKLANRRDEGGQVILYYKLTKLGSEPGYRLTGEGVVKVTASKGDWVVTWYSAYF